MTKKPDPDLPLAELPLKCARVHGGPKVWTAIVGVSITFMGRKNRLVRFAFVPRSGSSRHAVELDLSRGQAMTLADWMYTQTTNAVPGDWTEADLIRLRHRQSLRRQGKAEARISLLGHQHE